MPEAREIKRSDLVAGSGVAVFLAGAALAGRIAGSGVWITYGHISDFQRQLRDLR